MKIYLTLNTSEENIDIRFFERNEYINYGDVYLKYNISVTDSEKYENRFKFLVKELSFRNTDVIVLGNPCYNLSDILKFNKELAKENLAITGIYIPTPKRINDMKSKAYEEYKTYNRLLGTSEKEIDKNFMEYKNTLKNIREYCNENSIGIFEV